MFVLFESADETPDALLRNADAAMYEAKEEGRGRYKVFGPRMHARALRRLDLENSLKRAIEEEEFKIHYQPIVSLDTRRITGMEALLRWESREYGLVPPDRFIPIAEETGLIEPLGRWTIKEAIRQARRWTESYPVHSPLTMSVNLSAQQFRDPHLLQELRECLQEADF